MKNIFFILSFLVAFMVSTAQTDDKKSRKERKEEKKTQKMEMVKKAIDNKTYVFNATHVLPLGGGSKYLNYDYDVTINQDTVTSYLPFFGVAYRVEYGSTDLAFDFKLPIEEYRMEKEKDGYTVELEADKGMDNLNYSFHISDVGFATLHVTSTNRQSITYYGTIQEISKEEE